MLENFDLIKLHSQYLRVPLSRFLECDLMSWKNVALKSRVEIIWADVEQTLKSNYCG